MGETQQFTRADDDVEILCRAGEQALHDQGDLRAARSWFDAAYRHAERAEDGATMARAALGLGGLWVHEHRAAADAARVAHRQLRALACIDPGSPLGIRLRARIAAEQDYRDATHDTILAILDEARRSESESGDARTHAATVAEVLSLAHNCVLGPEHGPLRLRLAHELIGEASGSGRHGDLLMGLLWRTVDLFLAADRHAERSLRELCEQLARGDHLAVRFIVSCVDVMQTIRNGRLGEAEQLAEACGALGAEASDRDTTAWYGGQLATIRWYQGRIGELLPLVTELVNSPTLSATDNSYFGILATSAAVTGDLRLAQATLARLRGPGLAHLPRASSWLITMYCVAEAAYLLGDADVAAEAYALLEPFAHLPMIASLGVTCVGSAQHALGTAALAMGDLDAAARHLRAAVAGNLALGHWPAVVFSRARLARVLELRGDPAAEAERARAAREAAMLDMGLPPEPPSVAVAVPVSPVVAEPAGTVTCRRNGRRWLVELSGRTAHVADSVGMGYLATLLANPGREIPAADLAAGPTGASADTGSAQPVLDAAALNAYRMRLAELDRELDECAAFNDTERAAALRAERGWLIDEMTAATGFGGRARAFTGNQERARIAVGKAVRRAIARIHQADPEMGAHLQSTIRTGSRCAYLPPV